VGFRALRVLFRGGGIPLTRIRFPISTWVIRRSGAKKTA